MQYHIFGWRRVLVGTLLVLTVLFFTSKLTIAQAESLSFDEMYASASAYGYTYTDKLLGLAGKKVTMVGYMAPPLKPTINFFVLTAVPMSVCPFCSTDADWPDNIIVVKLPSAVTALPYDSPVSVTGTLEVGSEVDEETGFISPVRINATDVSAI